MFPRGQRFNQQKQDNLAILQKKVDDLEKVHIDGKRAHRLELERLSHDLAVSQKLAADTADKLDKQRKQKAALDATLLELKKASLSDQGEIKDLRHKLRLLELERDKTSSRQPELNELRKSLHALETKRKEDIRDRDRRITDLEKNLDAEKKKRELLESKNQNTRRLFDDEMQTLQTALKDKDALLQVSEQKLQNNTHQEDELLHQLECHRSLLGAVAQQYGALASQSASLSRFNQLQRDYATLQHRQFRLERKLANSEGQVVELTHLIRQVKEKNTLLDRQLRDAMEEISFLSQPVSENYRDQDAQVVDQHLPDDDTQLSDACRVTDTLLSTYYRLKADQLYFTCTVFAKEHSEALALAEQREADLSSALASHEAIASRLESIQKERLIDQEALQKVTVEAATLRSSVSVLQVQLSDARQQLEEVDSRHAAALKKEKDTIQRLASTVQKNRMAEDALRAEIDKLAEDLTSAEGYQDAYGRLYDQVGSLITRNQIAEEEADRISKFNAEILGHNNPAQRIMYVDRIRTELAEAKMQIAELTREQDNLAAQNGELEHELFMYKSVRVDNKPRTNLTRIGRPPLVNLTHSLNSNILNVQAKPAFKIAEPLQEVSHADLTLDELM